MHYQGRVFTSADYYRVSVQHNEELPADARSSGRYTTTISNNSSMDIAVKTRMSPTLYLDSNTHPSKTDHVSVAIHWSMSGHAFDRTMQEMERGDSAEFVTDQILKSMDARWPSHRVEKRDRQNSGYLTVDIRIQDIIDNGGSAYIQDLDLTICIDERAQLGTTHPCDRTLKVKKELEAIIPYIGPETFIFGIKAVDNNKNRVYSDRFMLVGDKVQKIPIERHTYLKTGIHILMRPPITADEDDHYLNNISPQMFTFEQADRLFGLADTIEKVLNGGDLSTAYKNKLAERNHERVLLEIERKEELAATEAEFAKAKARDNQQKAAEEKNREEIKGFGDWVRAITGALTAVVALTGIFMKLKPA